MIGILDDIGDVLLTLGDMLSDVSHGFFLIHYGVARTNTKAIMQKLMTIWMPVKSSRVASGTFL